MYMRRNLFSMKDDQRKAMFASMRGGSRFADAPDIPKVTVSYGDTTVGGGEPEPIVEIPKVEETKIEEPVVESTVDGIPSSVSSAFDMFDRDMSTGAESTSSGSQEGTFDFDAGTSYTVGDKPQKPVISDILLDESIPEVTSYEFKGKGLELSKDGYVPISIEDNLIAQDNGTVLDYKQELTSVGDKRKGLLEVVMPEQNEIEVKSIVSQEDVPESTSRSRLERYQDTLNKVEGFMGKIEDDIEAIDPATNDPAEQERLKLLISNLSNQRHQYESIKKMMDKEKYPETFQGQFKKGWDVGMQKAGGELAGAIIKSPVTAARTAGGAISGAGRLAEREFNLGVAVGGGALARGTEAFGASAGVGVTEAIRGVGDIIEGPQQEFHIPPGYQKIWDGSKYVVRPQPQYPMEPWAVSKSFGVGMPPGVEPRVQGQSAVPVRDVSRIWGPAAVVAQERGYGGVDYLWGVKDIEQQGFKPMFDVPKMPTPDYMRVGREKQHMWVIPPAEVLYGVQVQPQPKSPYRGTVQRTSYVSSSGVPSMMQRTQGAIVPSNEMLTDGKIRTATLNKIPLLPRFPSDKAKIVPIKMPKTVSRVISDSERLNEISNISGVGSPEYVKQEAKVQSGLDYATRHNLPGSQGRTALEGYGLVSPSGV